MAGKKGLKKRVWSDDEKRVICAQTLTPGVSVRGGSVCLNRFRAFSKWFSASVTPPPLRASAG